MNDNDLDGHNSATERENEAKLLGKFPNLRRYSRHLLWVAIAMIVLGTIGLGYVTAISVASVVFFGALCVVGGILQLFHAFQGDNEVRWSGLVAVCYFILGVIILLNPISSTIVLTWMIAGFILATGMMRIIFAFKIKTIQSNKDWLMMLVSGVLSVILAIILMTSSGAEVWFIGMMISLELLFDGFALLFVAIALREKMQRS